MNRSHITCMKQFKTDCKKRNSSCGALNWQRNNSFWKASLSSHNDPSNEYWSRIPWNELELQRKMDLSSSHAEISRCYRESSCSFMNIQERWTFCVLQKMCMQGEPTMGVHKKSGILVISSGTNGQFVGVVFTWPEMWTSSVPTVIGQSLQNLAENCPRPPRKCLPT